MLWNCLVSYKHRTDKLMLVILILIVIVTTWTPSLNLYFDSFDFF